MTVDWRLFQNSKLKTLNLMADQSTLNASPTPLLSPHPIPHTLSHAMYFT
ncbi:MAG: hypothetical protein KME27_18385 [Lyngbya sp. HA4199-MV5]|nr:hypothetical protein [Lyngbya sp. HA4199-MV5]